MCVQLDGGMGGTRLSVHQRRLVRASGGGDKNAGESESIGNTRYARLHTTNSVISIPAPQRDLRLGVAAGDGRMPIVDPSSLPLSFILDAFWRIGDE